MSQISGSGDLDPNDNVMYGRNNKANMNTIVQLYKKVGGFLGRSPAVSNESVTDEVWDSAKDVDPVACESLESISVPSVNSFTKQSNIETSPQIKKNNGRCQKLSPCDGLKNTSKHSNGPVARSNKITNMRGNKRDNGPWDNSSPDVKLDTILPMSNLKSPAINRDWSTPTVNCDWSTPAVNRDMTAPGVNRDMTTPAVKTGTTKRIRKRASKKIAGTRPPWVSSFTSSDELLNEKQSATVSDNTSNDPDSSDLFLSPSTGSVNGVWELSQDIDILSIERDSELPQDIDISGVERDPAYRPNTNLIHDECDVWEKYMLGSDCGSECGKKNTVNLQLQSIDDISPGLISSDDLQNFELRSTNPTKQNWSELQPETSPQEAYCSLSTSESKRAVKKKVVPTLTNLSMFNRKQTALESMHESSQNEWVKGLRRPVRDSMGEPMSYPRSRLAVPKSVQYQLEFARRMNHPHPTVFQDVSDDCNNCVNWPGSYCSSLAEPINRISSFNAQMPHTG